MQKHSVYLTLTKSQYDYLRSTKNNYLVPQDKMRSLINEAMKKDGYRIVVEEGNNGN